MSSEKIRKNIKLCLKTIGGILCLILSIFIMYLPAYFICGKDNIFCQVSVILIIVFCCFNVLLYVLVILCCIVVGDINNNYGSVWKFEEKAMSEDNVINSPSLNNLMINGEKATTMIDAESGPKSERGVSKAKSVGKNEDMIMPEINVINLPSSNNTKNNEQKTTTMDKEKSGSSTNAIVRSSQEKDSIKANKVNDKLLEKNEEIIMPEAIVINSSSSAGIKNNGPKTKTVVNESGLLKNSTAMTINSSEMENNGNGCKDEEKT